MPFANNQSCVSKPPFWVAMQLIFTRNIGIKHLECWFPFFSSCDFVSCPLAWPVNRVSQVTSQRPIGRLHRASSLLFPIHTYKHTYILYSTGLFSHNVNYYIILVIKKRKLLYSGSMKFKIIQNIFKIISYEIYY